MSVPKPFAALPWLTVLAQAGCRAVRPPIARPPAMKRRRSNFMSEFIVDSSTRRGAADVEAPQAAAPPVRRQ